MKKDAYGGAGRRKLTSEGRWGRKGEMEVEKCRERSKKARRKMEVWGGEKRKQSPLDEVCNRT